MYLFMSLIAHNNKRFLFLFLIKYVIIGDFNQSEALIWRFEQFGFIGLASTHAMGGHIKPKPKPNYHFFL